jgi:hypothetical protein
VRTLVRKKEGLKSERSNLFYRSGSIINLVCSEDFSPQERRTKVLTTNLLRTYYEPITNLYYRSGAIAQIVQY